jgi:hypothetical protein
MASKAKMHGMTHDEDLVSWDLDWCVERAEEE